MKEHKNKDTGDTSAGEETPLCPRCFAPYNPLQHYCEECGEAVGQYTPYLPFVNIRFNLSIFDVMWKRIRSREVSWLKKAFYLFLIFLLAPIMLVGLPFVIAEKLRRKKPGKPDD